MMKRRAVGFALCLVVLLLLPPAVAAYHASFADFYDWGPWYRRQPPMVLAEATPAAALTLSQLPSNPAATAAISPTRSLLPTHPLYIFKSLAERLQILTSFDPATRMQRQLAIGEERLAEAAAFLEQKNYPLAAESLQRYRQMVGDLSAGLGRLAAAGRAEAISAGIEPQVANHSLYLEKLSLVVPAALTPVVTLAAAASLGVLDASADALGRPAIPTSLKQRIESLTAIGVLSEADTTNLLGRQTRREVRDHLARLSEEGLLPAADEKKLDEAQERFFPADYLRVAEVKKFLELNDWLSDSPDEETQRRLRRFGTSFRLGAVVPPDLRSWWLREQRVQELIATIRPDLVVESLPAQDAEEYQQFSGVINALRPTPAQLAQVESWARQNPSKVPPPEIARILSLAVNLGTPAPWTPPAALLPYVSTGYPSAEPGSADQPVPTGSGTPAPLCLNSDTRAKNSLTGEIKVFPTTCLPPGWYPYPTDTVWKDPISGKEFVPTPGTAPHVATAECGAAGCKVYRCDWGWRDTDGIFSNGCEARDPSPGPTPTPMKPPVTPVDVAPPIGPPGVPTKDAAGNVYINPQAPHVALPECGFGVCRVVRCEEGWYDLNGAFIDGCESSSPGVYQTPPPPVYGTPPNVTGLSCSGTECKIVGCSIGWLDKNGSYTDGCETQMITETYTTPYGTPNTVGTFDKPHVTKAECGSWGCKIFGCESGWYDTNGVFDDGCESSTPPP